MARLKGSPSIGGSEAFALHMEREPFALQVEREPFRRALSI